MNRREFLTLSATGIIGLSASSFPLSVLARGRREKSYSLVILGDTHFDADPPTVYHSLYNEPDERRNKIHRAEFARNGEMWKDRCPRLLRRAAGLIDKDTRMVLQMGDLVQGDCGSGEVHKKMLSDVMNRFKQELGGLPFVTVVGNHDIRGTDALQTYHSFMPARMSEELGKPITKTTFGFNIGDDAFIVVDFNNPDDEEIDRLLDDTKGARHTFVLTHGPVFPSDDRNCRWIFHGGASEQNTQARLHFRNAFARRNAIVLCGHTHCTDFMDWCGDGGRITQMTMSSVWTSEKQKQYTVRSEGAPDYGMLRKKIMESPDGANLKDESALFDEYRPGIRQHTNSRSQGSYKLNVNGKHVTIDFYGGDSTEISQQFIIR
ncbi:MAG: metallophosphoesterase [Bacteroidaceae bacterium]|nr:metallophosphoesterase [Bacteroidaceae bacterium]